MRLHKTVQLIIVTTTLSTGSFLWARNYEPPPEEFMGLPLVTERNFDQPDPADWNPTDPDSWKFTTDGERSVYALVKDSDYQPEYIAPLNYSILQDVYVSDFVCDLWVRSTMKDYAHRDMCVFFGYQNPTQFYYVHFGLRSDKRSNSIMKVDAFERRNIVNYRTDGTPWTNDYHHVRVIRRVDSGKIEIYFDDMQEPSMTTVDHRFKWGKLGVGSFDDIGNIDRMVIWGNRIEPPVTLNAETPWVVSKDEAEPFKRTMEDIKGDWYKVLGRPPIVLNEMPEKWSGPMLFFGNKAEWLDKLDGQELPGRESFHIRVVPPEDDRGTAVIVHGADMRGAMFGAYTFSEKFLMVDPMYYWVDNEPAYRSEAYVPKHLNYEEGAPTFKYRGLFINDEDLLGGWAKDPLKECIFAPQTWDMVYETLLRLKGNMIVPGTFTFPDEHCRELAAERGLYIHDHHINVCGLNTFQWPEDLTYSYARNPGLLEKAWQICIDAMKNWDMVWTVGYRGKHDRPFWFEDRSVDTPKKRGKIISNAIAKQVKMIRKVQPNADIVTNLWAEGVGLYKNNLLQIPEEVTIVWPDDGSGTILDGGNVQSGQGVYYHTAMVSNRDNQLTELVPPSRIFSELGRFVNAGATEFFLVNVSDIRPVPLSTEAAMRFVWNPGPYMEKDPEVAMKDYILGWCERQYGEQMAGKVTDVIEGYFNIPYIQKHHDSEHRLLTMQKELAERINHFLQKDQKPGDKTLKKARTAVQYVKESIPYLEELSGKAGRYTYRVPRNRWDYYQAHVLSQIAIHQHLSQSLRDTAQAVLAHADEDKATAKRKAENALQELDNTMSALRKAEKGKWRGFYRNEMFTKIYHVYDLNRKLLASLRGVDVEFIRGTPRYPELYEYQDKVRENYPLFYPSDKTLRN